MRSNDIFLTATRVWGPVAVFRAYSYENSPAEEPECLRICPRLRAKALQSDLNEDLKSAVFEFCAFSHLGVIKIPEKIVMLFFAVGMDFISFRSIFSFIAIAEKVWGFLVLSVNTKIFHLVRSQAWKALSKGSF